jgi:hypothetical protein
VSLGLSQAAQLANTTVSTPSRSAAGRRAQLMLRPHGPLGANETEDDSGGGVRTGSEGTGGGGGNEGKGGGFSVLAVLGTTRRWGKRT